VYGEAAVCSRGSMSRAEMDAAGGGGEAELNSPQTTRGEPRSQSCEHEAQCKKC